MNFGPDERHAFMAQAGCNVCVCGFMKADPMHDLTERPALPTSWIEDDPHHWCSHTPGAPCHLDVTA